MESVYYKSLGGAYSFPGVCNFVILVFYTTTSVVTMVITFLPSFISPPLLLLRIGRKVITDHFVWKLFLTIYLNIIVLL